MRGLRWWRPLLLAGVLVLAGVCPHCPQVALAQDTSDDLFSEEDDDLGDLFGDEPLAEDGAAGAAPEADETPAESADASEEAPVDDFAEEPRTSPGLAPPAITSSDIEEIVITGSQSTGSEDFKTADSVASFDAEDLAALGADDIGDLAAFTPNLEIVTTGSTTPTFFIRGIGLNDFNANSATAVSIYEDDVPRASQGLQLAALYDMADVNILRGPQGTGSFRNASAGAIKLYARKPSGNFGGYLRSSYGNFDSKDFEGAVEAPITDTLSTRVAFRFRQRDGIGRNGCANAPPFANRLPRSGANPNSEGSGLRICGEDVINTSGVTVPGLGLVSGIPVGLEREVNNLDHWAARAMFALEPDIPGFESSWLLKVQGSRVDQLSTLGQSMGTGGTDVTLPNGAEVPRLGGPDRGGSRDQDIFRREEALLRLFSAPLLAGCQPSCTPAQVRIARGAVRNDVSLRLRQGLATLDNKPFRGDYNHVGPTRSEVWGASLRGDMLLPHDVNFRSITGFDTYDRLVDVDLDFSPNTLFEIKTEDRLKQFSQDVQFAGEAGDDVLLAWDAGGYYLREELDVHVNNDLGDFSPFSVSGRDYLQTTDSFGLYANLKFDLGLDFTLDGGLRYNWERKRMDYTFLSLTQPKQFDVQTRSWDAPTGTVRLTYHFRDDTHAYLKYSRGWKAGHFNATSGTEGVTAADPETLDAFEAGIRGSWFDGIVDVYAAVFHYNYENYQVFTTSSSIGGIDFVIVNAKAVEVFGAELEFSVAPWEWSEVGVNVGWLESQFTDFVQIQQDTLSTGVPGTGDIVNREVNNTGNRVLNSPRFKLSLSAQQSAPLGNYGSVFFRYDAAWTDEVHFDGTAGHGIPDEQNQEFLPDNTIGQKDYWLHNLNLGYRTPNSNIELTLWVRNLDNKEYKTYSFDGTTFQDTTIHFLGDPRTFGGTLEIRF